MTRRLLLPVLVALFLASAASAATITTIYPSAHEPNLSFVLDSVYGAGNYFRIDDDSDQTWAPGEVSVRALGTYAGAVQTLGYCVLCNGSDDVQFDQMLIADGIFSTPLTVWGAASISIASSFRWFDNAQSWPTVGKVYSDPFLNPGGADHMVTFGLVGKPDVFVVGVEDWLYTSNPVSDKDYQDMVFEVTYLNRQPPSLENPEPGALFTLAGGLAALFWFRRRS